MSGAMGLQQYRGAIRARRVLALATAVWFVACGVVGAWHEADVAHVVDPSGRTVHAGQLSGHHTGGDSDVHGSARDTDHGLCALSAALHQAVHPARHRLVVAACDSNVVVIALHSCSATAAAAIYLIAPKTSPPALG